MPERRTRTALRPAKWFSAACLVLASTFATANDVVPFSASYAADMRNVPVNGEATHTLTSNEDGSWTLNFHAGMFVARLTEESTFRMQQGEIQPLRYRYERRGLGRSRTSTAEFDHDAGQVTGKHRGERFELPMEEGLLDKVSYQFALQRDLLAGKTEMNYRVVDGDDVEDYAFKVVGEQRVTTRVGQFDAVAVERVRDEGARRQTTLWFAKDFQYLLVRLNQIETDGQHYQIVLKDAVIDGKPVTGIPIKRN